MKSVEVRIVVEGQTEKTFVRDILAPAMGREGVFLHAAILGKPGHKGGDVRFERAAPEIMNHLLQRSDTYVSTLFDLYGINSRWPGKADITPNDKAGEKARKMETATLSAMKELAVSDRYKKHNLRIEQRFIPYIAMHEFEALLFSDAEKLAQQIGVEAGKIHGILKACEEPEEINDHPDTAPSKRLNSYYRERNEKYRKVAKGKEIAESIGIRTMRAKCPHFDEWLNKFQSLPPL
ncbi:MAG: DUF4276 family protein [bacterium]|nr:DUF4276 family protein [bacterium]